MADKKKTAPVEKQETQAPAKVQGVAVAYNRSLKFGATGEDVKALQTALAAAGRNVIVNGVYDQRTVKAVQAQQKAKGFPATGMVRKAYIERLLE